MDYIIYGTDGRVIKTNFTDLIQVGNNNVNKIFVSIDGLDAADYTASGLFTLPDKTLTTEIGVLEQNYEYESGVYADGYLITITQDETKYAGKVFLSIQLLNASDNSVLFTYKVVLTINDTGVATDIASISLDQYSNLLTYLSTQLGLKEDLANKVTSLSASSTDDEYPSAKAVFDELANYVPIIEHNTTDTIENCYNDGKPFILKCGGLYYLCGFYETYFATTQHYSFEIEEIGGGFPTKRWAGSGDDMATETLTGITNNFATTGSNYKPYALASDIPSIPTAVSQLNTEYNDIPNGKIAEHIGYGSGGTIVKEEGEIPHLYRHHVVVSYNTTVMTANIVSSRTPNQLNDLEVFIDALTDYDTVNVEILNEDDERLAFISVEETQQDEFTVYGVNNVGSIEALDVRDIATFTDTVTTIL